MEKSHHSGGFGYPHSRFVIGVIFYNFRPPHVLDNDFGVDLVLYFTITKDTYGFTYCILWVCPMMGFLLSPYSEIKGLIWASDMDQGDRNYPDKPLSWYMIRLNIQGVTY